MATFPVETHATSDHLLAISWHWENMDGVTLIAPTDAPTPKLVIEVAQLDPCPHLNETDHAEP